MRKVVYFRTFKRGLAVIISASILATSSPLASWASDPFLSAINISNVFEHEAFIEPLLFVLNVFGSRKPKVATTKDLGAMLMPAADSPLFDGLEPFETMLKGQHRDAQKINLRDLLVKAIANDERVILREYQARLAEMDERGLAQEFDRYAQAVASRYTAGPPVVQNLYEWLRSRYHVVHTTVIVSQLSAKDPDGTLALEAAFLLEVFGRWQRQSREPASHRPDIASTPRLSEKRAQGPLFPMLLHSDGESASVIVNAHGAQLSSLYVEKKEVLSNGDSAWGGVTVVGPWVGRAMNGFVPSSTGESVYVGDSPYVQMLDGHALNGMLMRMRWKVDEQGPASHRNAVRLIPEDSSQMGGPYGGLQPALSYQMMGDGVTMGWEITNRGMSPVQASFGFHNVFDTPEGEGWTLTLSASHHIATLVPTDGFSEPVAGTAYDFHGPKALDGVHWDFGLTGFSPGVVTATLQNRAGRKIELSWNASDFPVAWIWVEHGHAAIEPFMSPPNLQQAPQFQPNQPVRARLSIQVTPEPSSISVKPSPQEVRERQTEIHRPGSDSTKTWEGRRDQVIEAMVRDVQKFKNDPNTPPHLVRLAEVFESIYPKLPEFASRLLADYLELSQRYGAKPGRVRLVLCNARANKAPLKSDSDIDLKVVVELPDTSLFPPSLPLEDPIYTERVRHLYQRIQTLCDELSIPYYTDRTPLLFLFFAEPLMKFGPEMGPHTVILAMGELDSSDQSGQSTLTLPQTYKNGTFYFKKHRRKLEEAIVMLGKLGEMERLESLYGQDPNVLADKILRRTIELFFAPDHEIEFISDPIPRNRRTYAQAHGTWAAEEVVESIYAVSQLGFEEAEAFMNRWSGAGLGYKLAMESVREAFDEANGGSLEQGQQAVNRWSHFLHNLMNPGKVLTLESVPEGRSAISRRYREYARSREFLDLLSQAMRKGWTQGRLAHRLGIHQANISRMLRGRELPYESTVQELMPKLKAALKEEPPAEWHFRSKSRAARRTFSVAA